MSSPKVTAAQFIDFLIATPSQARATEAQWTQPETADPAAHDAYTRLLHRLEPDSETLWIEVQPEVRRASGVLVLDDSVLDKDGTTAHWATSDLELDELERLRLADDSWRIEESHRGLKQVTNVERCQCRKGVAQRGHIGLALRAFLVIEKWCFHTGRNWLSAQWGIVRDAIRADRTHPHDRQPNRGTA